MSNDLLEYTLVDTVISAWMDSNEQVGAGLQNLNELGNDGWEVVSDTILYGKGSNGMQ